jgi:hypothetical protein
MDQSTLVDEWKEAGKLFLAEFSRRYPLKTAFWLKEGEDSPWYLYVASEKIEGTSFHDAYTEVVQAARQVRFDPSRVKLVRLDDPIVKAVLDIQARQPSTSGGYFHGLLPGYHGLLPGTSGVDGAYFYPASNMVSG